MSIKQVGCLVAVALGLGGCGSGEGSDAVETMGSEAIGESQQAITTWVNLDLRNGWKVASNSVTPAVGIVNGIVTFRGSLDGSQATSAHAFCLGAAKFNPYRTTDVGNVILRVAMANGVNGSMVIIGITVPGPAADQNCAYFQQDGTSASPGTNAKIRTSLDGVSYDRTFSDSIRMPYGVGWDSPYPHRGSDGNAHPDGQGMFAKLVNGFVRFQGGAAGGGASSLTLFNLPSGQGLIPGKTVYLPIDTCGGLGGQARLVVQTSGAVDLTGLDDDARCAVHLDGLSYSMSSPASAKPINLGNNWSAYSTRAVRARNDNGVIRLEGAVRNGNATTIGTLPEATMYPTKTVYLVADAIATPQSGQISISNTGVIKLVAPSLALGASGLSLDGISFHP